MYFCSGTLGYVSAWLCNLHFLWLTAQKSTLVGLTHTHTDTHTHTRADMTNTGLPLIWAHWKTAAICSQRSNKGESCLTCPFIWLSSIFMSIHPFCILVSLPVSVCLTDLKTNTSLGQLWSSFVGWTLFDEQNYKPTDQSNYKLLNLNIKPKVRTIDSLGDNFMLYLHFLSQIYLANLCFWPIYLFTDIYASTDLCN